MSVLFKDELCRLFTLDEIKTATSNFDENLIIGKGGFGVVYIGSINNGTEVAMKRLSLGSTQGETEFLREIETLSKLQHDHLVRLKGYCNESQEMILVYEYMPNGTLADHLYKKGGSTSADGDNPQSGPTWEKRLNICIGVARGLDYLHRESVPGIIHRDIKDSNILLDDNFVAKIADFGLAKLVKISSESQTTIVSSTGVKGTFGYLDPEYFYTQRLSKKTDVYAFGVLLLVVLCGRPAVDSKAAEDQRSLAEWSQKCIQKNKIDQIIDPYLAGNISSMSLKQFVKVSQKCLRRQSEKRPTMEEVVLGLELALRKQPTAGSSSKQSNGRSSLTQMRVKLQIVLAKRQSGVEKLYQRFSVYGVKTATQNFSEELIIGQGDLGTVYIGRLNSGPEVAIKKTTHGVIEFWRDFDLLCQLQHDHVISLKGYCNRSSEMVHVYYEHMSQGNLEKHLSKIGVKQQARMTYGQLIHLCICAARGLDLLHRVSEPEVIHHNVERSNLMSNDKSVPKISGCGMSILGDGDKVGGTHGFIDPEVIFTNEVKTESDVYGFGVFMLVVLSGIEAHGNVVNGQQHLRFRALKWIEENSVGDCLIINPHLRGAIKSTSLEQFLELAVQCSRRQSEHRPTMEEVVAQLELALELEIYSSPPFNGHQWSVTFDEGVYSSDLNDEHVNV